MGAGVSIIMPAYNAEKTIAASISSALSQTYRDFELIIADDSSSDKTPQIAKEFAAKDSRVQLLSNSSDSKNSNNSNPLKTLPSGMGVSDKKPSGLGVSDKKPSSMGVSDKKPSGAAAARNLGLKHAKGEWLAFLDADDIWHTDKLAKQLKFIEETGANISYTATAYMNESSEMYGYILRAKKELTYNDLLKGNLMSCSSVMVRQNVMIPFPHGYMHEDYAVWLNLVREYGCAYGLDEPLLNYRMAKGSKSSRRYASAKMIYNSYRHAGYGSARAAALTLRYAKHSVSKRKSITAGHN